MRFWHSLTEQSLAPNGPLCGYFDLSKAVGTTRAIWVYDLAHTPTVRFAQLAASRFPYYVMLGLTGYSCGALGSGVVCQYPAN
jgi:hypothetical protein